MKLGDRHTAIMDAIHGDLLRQNPGAFVEEDGNATLVIPTKPFLTIDVSSLAEAVLPLAASPPAREEAPAEGAAALANRVIALGYTNTAEYALAKAYLALRNRTSEPEAGSVACSRCGGTNLMLCDCSLPHNPAPATADKLRIAAGLLNDCIWLDTDTGDYRVEHDGSVEKARAILAALNEQPQ